MSEIKEKLSGLHEAVVKKIGEYNEALKANDLAKAIKVEQELKELESDYAEMKALEVFNELKEKENPVREAIATHSYYVVSHRVLREDGVIKGFEIIEDKVRQIDLVKFCKHCKLDTMWQYSVERFNQLLALRAANELKMNRAQIKKICDSFYMNKLAREIEMGGTPDSNTAICKQLQQVLDAIIFEDNGKGKNVFRVNNHDVAYLLMCYTKRGKKVLSVAVAKHSYMHRLIMDVAHRIVTGKAYDLEYRMIADSPTETKSNNSKSETKSEAKTKTAKKKSEKVSDTTEAPAEEVIVEKKPA